VGAERTGDWITAALRGGALTEFQGHGRRECAHRLGGLYAFQPEAIPFLRANPGVMTHVPVGGMPPLECEIAESLAAMAAAGLPVQGLPAEGILVDVDKPWHLLEATQALLQDRSRRLEESSIADGARVAESAEIHGRLVLAPGAEIGERVVVHGDLWLGPGASVTNGSIVGPRCIVGAGARVRDYALLGEDTVLGPETICGHGAEFEGVLLDGAYLYHYCEISGVLGSRVDIGAATVCGTLRFDDGPATHTILGRREQPPCGANASYLGDYSRTGVNAILMPGVKVGAYSCVGPGVVLHEDLPSREMVLVKQELVRKPWGPERYGW
jgi:bifunctional UDP-N-acetylglucosamine pyrophosphorylase/glucosamine-1-phosphate N-acetyltransferase